MPRTHSIRSVVRSFFQRPQSRLGAAPRARLGVTPLEERVVPAFVDVSGLRFDTPGNFTQSPAGSGTKYDSGAATVQVGLAPVAPATFVPLFTLDGGGTVTDTGTKASPYTWNTGVSAVTSGAPLPLFAGRADTQTVAQTLPDAAPAAPHTGADRSVPLGPFTLTPSGFRIASAHKLGLAGTLGLADFGGIKLADIGLGKFATAPADAGATFSVPTVEGGFQLGANGGFNVGGLTFKAGTNATQPNVGGYARVTTATGLVEVAGQAKVTIAGNPVDVASGQYDVNDASKFVAGASFLGGVPQKFDLKVTSDLKLGGLTFTAKELLGSYDRPASTFTLKGTAGLNLKGSSVSVNLGGAATAGLTVTNGTVTNAAFTVDSTLKLGGLTFTAKALAGTYDNVSSTFTLKGTAGFDLKGNTVAVTFGDKTTAGLVITDGSVRSAAFTVDADIKLGGLAFKANSLAATYDDATSTYTVRGGASFDLKGSTVNVTLGGKTTAGLVIANGSVTSADFSVDAKIAVGGVTFTATDLRATYADASSTYTLKGAASFALKGSTVNVTFGDKTTAGLVIVGGAVTSADFSVDAKIVVGGLTFTATDLRATYADASNTYTLKGTATFALEGSTVTVTLGDSKGVGLVVTDGAVKSFDFSVDSKVVIGGVTITSKDLRATYADADATYTLAGGATATVTGLGTLGLTLGSAGKPGLVIKDGSLTNLDATVNSDVTVAGVAIKLTGVQLTYAAATSLYTLAGAASATVTGIGTLSLTLGADGKPGAVIQNGSLVSLDGTVGTEFKVANVTVKATALRLTYTAATTQFTLGGTASADIAGIGAVALTFGFGGKPGLVLQEGSLALLDATLNSDITVSGVKIATTGLNLTYTAANSQFTLAGSATATITGLGPVNLTFGFPGKPGLVIASGSLVSLDVTLNSDITVSKVRVTTTGLNLTYTAATGTFTLAGAATAAIAGLGTVGLTFGATDATTTPATVKPGLVITAGSLTSLDVTLTSDLTVSGVKVTTTGLNLTYTAATGTFTLAGDATAAITGLGTVALTFGFDNKPGLVPGLVVKDGALASLDLTLNSDLKVSGVTITTKGLRLTYTAATGAFTLAGAATADITGLGKLGVTLGFGDKPGLVIQNGALVSLDATLTSDIEVSKVKITTPAGATTGLRLTYTAANSQFTLAGTAQATIDKLGTIGVTFGYQNNPGLVVQDGTLAFLDLTLNANLVVSKVTLTTTGLRLTYTAATNQFTLAGAAQATIEKFGTVGITFGFQGKPGLVVRDGRLVNVDVTLNSDVTISNIRIVTTGLELSYSADGDRFTLTGSTVVSTPQLGSVNVTFGYDNKPGLVVENGALKSLDLRVNSNFTFLKYTFTVKDLDLSYRADSNTFTIRGEASVDLLLGSFAIRLGDGQGGQGLVVKDGKVVSIDATISGEVGVAFVSLGKVTLNLKYDGVTGRFDISGEADITLAIKLPSPVSLFLKGPSFRVGVVRVHVRVIPGDNANSFTEFNANVAGTPYGLKVTFSGEVTSSGLTEALYNGLKNAAANATKAVGNAVASTARSAARSVRRFFGGRDNELAGATVFYDLNRNRVLDPGEQSARLGPDGTAPQLATTAGVGQLVVLGGTNVGTNLPNKLALTAPADATKASPMSTLVQAIRAAQARDDQPDLSVADATVYVEVALGVPGAVDPLNDDVIQAAVGGSASAAKAFAADVEVATLAKGISALVGESGADGAAAFAALASLIVNTGGPLDLGDPAVVGQLIRDAAARLNVTLDPALVSGGAAVIAGIIARVKAIPAPDGAAFVRELNQIQRAASDDAFVMLAEAAAGRRDLNAVVAANTGAAFEAEVDAEPRGGVLAAPASNASPLYALGAGAGAGPMVRVYDRQTNALVASFFAFDPQFTGGVSVAVGDVTGDGVPDVVVGAGNGGHARVIVIDGTRLNAVLPDGQIDPSAIVASFFAFEFAFTGGATVCLARLSSETGLSIVVGAGAGGGPRVRTFDWNPTAAGGVTQLPGKVGDFFAFDPSARVGVNVAAGDLDGLGRDNLIVGAGAGGGPAVAVYFPDGTLRDTFFAGDSSARGGVSVAAGYLDGGLVADIVTGSGPGGPASVRIYQGDTSELLNSAPVFDSDFTGGVNVSVGPDIDGDVRVVVGAGPGGGPRVTILSDALQAVDDFFGFDPAFRGGVLVG